MNWYCIYTKPNQEGLALQNLENQGFEVYWPKIRKRAKRAGKVQEVVKGLFPSYLFASTDSDELLGKIRSTRGVAYPLTGPDGQALPVDDCVVDGIKAHCPDGIFDDEAGQLKEGDLVGFASGALVELDAIFVKELTDKQRALVLIDFIMGQQEIEVDLSLIEKKD